MKNSGKIYKCCSLAILLSLFAHPCISQISKTYPESITALILAIDTVQLNEESMDIPAMNVITRVVKLKIIKHSGIKINRISPFIIIDLIQSEHECNFNFKVGSTYDIKVYTSRYTSALINKKYRKMFYKIKCYHLPILL